MGEEVTVGEPKGEGVGGAIGEAGERDAGWVDVALGKGGVERAVEEVDVRAKAVDEEVPGVLARVRCEQHSALCQGVGTHEMQHAVAVTAGAVKQHE